MNEESKSILDQPIIAINLGLKQFADSLKEQEIKVVHILWSPPAGGDEEMIDLLDKLI